MWGEAGRGVEGIVQNICRNCRNSPGFPGLFGHNPGQSPTEAVTRENPRFSGLVTTVTAYMFVDKAPLPHTPPPPTPEKITHLWSLIHACRLPTAEGYLRKREHGVAVVTRSDFWAFSVVTRNRPLMSRLHAETPSFLGRLRQLRHVLGQVDHWSDDRDFRSDDHNRRGA